jgi:hypothetical protein
MSNPGNPTPGQLYADVLWDTSLLPAFVRDDLGNAVFKQVSGSINGVDIGTTSIANPLTQAQMIFRINTVISDVCYGGAAYVEATNTGFNCLKNQYTTNDQGTTTGQNIPSRYIIMGGRIPTGQGLVINQADLLQVTAVDQSTYLQTDWRSPPNYTQSNVV